MYMTTETQRKQIRPPTRWRVIAYLAVFALFALIVASSWMRPDFKWQETPDWKPALALAEESRAKGDLYEARVLFFRAGRIASLREDWEGLLATACGVKKLDIERGPYSATHTLLVRAMMAAESRQSRVGMSAVARAFASFGQQPAAAMALSRIQPAWPETAQGSVDVHVGACWEPDKAAQAVSIER